MSRYSQTVLADAPVAYYRCDDSSAVATDSSGYNNHGAWSGAPQIVDGLISRDDSKAGEFSARYLTVPTPARVSGTGAFAVELWFKTTSTANAYYVQRSGAYNGTFAIWSAIDPTGSPLIAVRFENPAFAGNFLYSKLPNADGLRHHLVVSRDASGLTSLWIDGVLQDSLVITKSVSSAGVANFGLNPIEGQSFTGLMDEMAIYFAALSADRVIAHYQAGIGIDFSFTQIAMSESISGLFVDASLQATATPNSSYPPALPLDNWRGDLLYNADITVRRTSGGLIEYAAETLTGRLNRQRFTNALFQAGPMYAEIALAAILGAAGVPFVSPLPAFYLRGSSSLIRPEFRAVTIAWSADDEDAPTVRDVLTEFFSAFSGYYFRANASDRLEVIAPSWATGSAPAVVLSLDDVLEQGWTVETADDTVVNLCTVKSNGYSFVANQTVAAQSAFETGWQSQTFPDLGSAPELERGPWSSSSNYAVNDAVTLAGARYRCILANTNQTPPNATYWQTSRFNGWLNITTSGFIPLETNVFTEGALTLEIVQSVADFRPGFIPTQQLNSTTHTLTLPADGSAVQLERNVMGFFSVPIATNKFNFYRVPGGVQVRVYQYIISPFSVFGNSNWEATRLEINVKGNKWQRTTTTAKGRFGDATDNANLSGLADSRTQFGVRESALEINVVQLDALTCQDIARSVVESGIRPTAVYTVPLAPPFRVLPSHLGRDISLPGAGVGIVSSWAYNESHAPLGSQTQSQIVVRLTLPLSNALSGSSAYGTAGYGISRYGG